MFRGAHYVNMSNSSVNVVGSGGYQVTNTINERNRFYNCNNSTVHNAGGVIHNDYSMGAQNSNHYSTSNLTDYSWRPVNNFAGDTYNTGAGSGSHIQGNFNNYPVENANPSAENPFDYMQQAHSRSQPNLINPQAHFPTGSGSVVHDTPWSPAQPNASNPRASPRPYYADSRGGLMPPPTSAYPTPPMQGSVSYDRQSFETSTPSPSPSPANSTAEASNTKGFQDPYLAKLKVLEDLGYTDKWHNTQILAKAQGDIDDAIKLLMEKPQ